MNSKFEQIIVLGSGSLATNCILHMIEADIPILIYEVNTTKIPTLELMATQRKLKYLNISKDKIFEELIQFSSKTLVFLLGCNYLIPSEVIRNAKLSIINYHNSLLPKHPGRNAEAWAIYEQDNITGITWHLVDDKIDNGDIIIQKEIPIGEGISAISLLRMQNQLALETFKEMFNDILEGTISIRKQNYALRGKLHVSTEIPNNGYLDVSWEINKIRAFLRAMDYGALRKMGHPKIRINNDTYIWQKVEYFELDNLEDYFTYNDKENSIVIAKNGKAVKLCNIDIDGGK